ncbi:MAG TPA: ABC transporter permease [Vicinamibacterales bacterium]|nr:ABC transporter permease [Vicinamibacterales bacterium]
MTPRPPLLARALGLAIARPFRDEVLSDLLDDHHGCHGRRSSMIAAAALAAAILRSAWDSHRHARLARAADHHSRGIRMTSFLRDLRFAARALARVPWLTLAALVTLSVGLGAALTMYVVADGILNAPVPWAAPDRLAMLSSNARALWGVRLGDHEEVAARSASIEAASAWQGWQATLTDRDGITSRVAAASVGGEFFRMLGVTPALGRAILPEDDQLGREPVVVLSDATWTRYFAGDPSAVGRSIDIDGAPYRIVGVMPAAFIDPINWAIFGNRPIGAWRSAPEVFDRGRRDKTWVGFWSVIRLKRDVSIDAAASEISAIARRIQPDSTGAPFTIATLREANTRGVRTTVYALLAAVVALVLIVCVNVANLLIGRGLGRKGEIALRLALGASRGAVIRQVLAESAILAGVGTGVGLLLALGGVRAVRAIAGPYGLSGRAFEFDASAVIAAVALALVTTLLCGLLPAWRSSKNDVQIALRETGRSQGPSRASQSLRRLLVVVETALACALLVQAGLLGRSLVNLLSVRPGFDADRALVTSLSLPPVPFARLSEQTALLDAVFANVRRMPGVEAAGTITDFPMSGAINSTSISIVGATAEPTQTLVRAIDGDYFDAVGVPVVRGRGFTEADRQGAAPVALVNESFVAKVLGGQSALGRQAVVRGVVREIVGVVRDVREFGLTTSGDVTLYTPYRQEAQDWMRSGSTLVVRAGDDPLRLSASLRDAVSRAAPGRPIGAVRLANDYLDRQLAVPRLQAIVIAAFATVSVLLAAIGLSGVLACAVAERLREIAIRLALGASRSSVARLIVGQSLWVTGIGLAGGLVGGWLLSGVVSGLLFGVTRTDPAVIGGTTALVLITALIASWAPARRAGAVDPMRTLKQ